MKAILTLLIAIVLTFSLSACAKDSSSMTKVKCPACGYEFDANPQEPS